MSQTAHDRPDWKFALLGDLARSGERRIFTAAEFHEFVQAFRPGTSASTARAFSDLLVTAGALRRVSSGVFLNRRATPPAELTEVASHIRAGAVISLHSVLGECGFLNNPSAVVMAVLPSSATRRPRLGEVKTSAGHAFRFFGLAERFFPASADERWELLQPGRPCETFRPEAALLHWLHLAGMRRSSLTPPPVDVDMEVLDLELLGKLAQRWNLQNALGTWRAKAETSNFGEEPSPSIPLTSSVSSEDAASARARLLARRRPSGS
jgi:hypothetical protein